MNAVMEDSEYRYLFGKGSEAFPDLPVGYAEEGYPSYWTWRRLSMFVLSLRGGRLPTPGEWQALHREIPTLSMTKKIWLYRQLRLYFSTEALKYLFHGWRPPSPTMDLSPWL